MSFQKAREAFEAKRNAANEMAELLDSVGDDGMSEEQEAKYRKLNVAYDAHGRDEERWLREGELNEESEKFERIMADQADEGQRDLETNLTPIETEARALLGLQVGQGVDLRSTPNDIGILGRRSLRAERRDTTDILAGTATDGAELVPTTLFGQLYVQLREGATSMFSLGRDVVTASGEPIVMPTVTSFSDAVLISEAGSITESTPQFSTITLNAYKYGLAAQISHEFQADNAVPGAMPWIIEQAADAIRRGVGAALITADGSSKPNGVDNGTNTTAVASETAVTPDELITAYHNITSGYRANAVWVFKDATVEAIRKLKFTDGSGATNQYMWQPGLQAGMPDRLLGKPVYTDDSLATMATSAKFGLFGDLKRGYIVRTVGAMRAERSVEYAFLNDLITWRFLGRFDGEIIDNNAYTVLVNDSGS